MFADIHPNLGFDPLQFRSANTNLVLNRMVPTLCHRMVVLVWSYFPGIRRKLVAAKEFALDGINSTDSQSILGLRKINMKTLAFRIHTSAD